MAHLPDPACVYGNTDLREIASDIYAGVYELKSDTHPPVLLSATIGDDGQTLTLVFDEDVTGNTGFSITLDGGAASIVYSSGDGTDTLVFSISRTVYSFEGATISYTPGDVEDLSGNALEAFSDQSVTNNSAQVFDPDAIAGLQGWYMADAGVTMDGSNRVSGWADQSGNARNLAQATDANKPIFVAAQYNGLGTLRFNGSTQLMSVVTNWWNALTGVTVFVVCKTNNAAANQVSISGNDGDRMQQNGNTAQFNIPTNGGSSYANTSTALQVRSAMFDGSQAAANRSRQWLNGVEQSVTNSNQPTQTGANTSIIVGRFGPSAAAFWNGDICEILLYNNDLSIADIDLINAYLEGRWL